MNQKDDERRRAGALPPRHSRPGAGRPRPYLLLAALLLGPVAVEAQGPTNPRRNILLLVCDDLNTNLGCYGHPLVKSPNIDRLAARGVRFERAYCQFPLCGPSRASFLTGRYPEQTGVLANAQDFRDRIPGVVTLPQHFRNHGYFAARVGKLYHYSVPLGIGTDGTDDCISWEVRVNPRGIEREVEDKIIRIIPDGRLGGSLSWLRLEGRDENHTDFIGATEAIRLMEEHHPKKTGRPFFLGVGFYRPHVPFIAPGKYFDPYPREKIDPPLERPGDVDDIPPMALANKIETMEIPRERRQEIIQAYYASITFADAQVGRVLDALDRLGLSHDTVVVLISDHGYLLGEHGFWHKNRLFEPALRIPMILATPAGAETAEGPRTQRLRSSMALAEMVDLYPTLAELAGLPEPPGVAGRSLVPVLRDPARAHREAAFSMVRRGAGAGAVRGASIRTVRFRYTEWGDDGAAGAELYDEEKDPDEYVNLAKDPACEEAAKKLKKLLRKSVEAGR